MKIKMDFKTRGMYLPMISGCFFLALLWFSCAWAGIDTAPSATWFVDMNHYAASAHGSLRCEECHGTMMAKGGGNGIEKPHPDPDAFRIPRTSTHFDYQTCGKCHKTAYTRFVQGAHAAAAEKEKTDGVSLTSGPAPNCGDCHSAHYSRSHLSRGTTGQTMTQTCGACHPEQQHSFLASYHGKAAVNLGYERSAFCTDCHGAHTIVSLKDKKAALDACLRCHSDATPEFANIIIHDTTQDPGLKNDAKQAGLKWVHALRILALTLVVAVLAFFYLHTGVLMLRKLHEKLRRHK